MSEENRAWVKGLSQIDIDCINQYEEFLGRPLRDYKEYHEIDSILDEMVLEFDSAEKLFAAYPELKNYAKPNVKVSLNEQIEVASAIASEGYNNSPAKDHEVHR